MTTLLVAKQYMKQIYSKYEVYITPLLKFLLAFLALMLINSKLGLCPDGDRILLTPQGEVTRFSHEAPESIMRWPTLAQFAYDAISEEC